MGTEFSSPSLVGLGDAASAARVYSALAIPSLPVEILRFVLSRREASTAEVMREFRITRNGARVHLLRLKRHDLLTTRHCTHPRGSGPITYWQADLPEIELLLGVFVDHVLLTPESERP